MRSLKLLRNTFLAAAAAAALVAAPLAAAPPALAASETHYIDNRAGSNCSDTGDGTSANAPWCTFAPAKTLTLGPGESLLLARGASWSEQLSVNLQGSAVAPATLGAYGAGATPRILNNSSQIGVSLTDPNNAVVSGLEIGQNTTPTTSGLAYGLMATYTTLDNHNLTISDLSVHDTWQIGVFVRATAPQSVTQTALTGLTFARIHTTHTAQGIAIAGQGALTDRPAVPTPGNEGSKVFTNVLVDSIDQSHDDAGQTLDRISELGVPCVGLTLQSANNVVVRNSVLDNEAACRTAVGTTALFLGAVNHVLLANNIIENTPNTMNPDMSAIDHEAMTNDVKIVGDYFADNYGGALEYLAIHGAADFSSNHLASANVFVRNGYQDAIPYPGTGSITQVGGDIPVTATLSDNLYSEPKAFLTANSGGSVAGMTSTNNISVPSATDISQSASQFTSLPWGYQSGSGSAWSSLKFDSAASTYSGSGVAIDRFTLTPTASTGAALTWTAPRAGVISLRGFPVADAGTAAVAVTRNGTTLASTTVDTAGTVMKADDVTVAAGDVLRFSVASGAGRVSWAPSVAYTSAGSSADPAGTWTFSVAGTAQGWTSSAPLTVLRGYASIATAAGTTTVDSPARLGLNAQKNSAIRLSYHNTTAATSGRIYFTTTPSQSFSAARSVAFDVEPAMTTGIAEGFQSVVIPMSANQNWKGNIQRIRIELTSSPGTFAIDSVQLFKPANNGWEFDAAAGWTVKPDVSCSTPGTASANPKADLDNTAGAFNQYADINWNFSRMQQFTVSTPRLAQVDFWAFKTGDPKGCLYFRVVKITDQAAHTGTALFTGAVPASAVSEAGGFVSVYPGLSGLDTQATYGLQIFSPYVIPGAGTYGLGYSDDAAKPSSAAGEYYSPDNRGTWYGPETNRSLKFVTYTAAKIAKPNPTAGYVPVTVAGGSIQGSGGYEPALLSPTNLGLTASSTRYIHIRMSNPDNRSTAYLLFTTKAQPTFDQPGVGWPVPNETGKKGISFSLVPGAAYHEYVLDMSTLPGWTGTIQQLMLEPATRWSYRIGDLGATWTGKIDYIRFS